MNITNYGHFTTKVRDSVLYHFRADGVDWYDLRRTLTTWGERGEFIDAVWPAWAMVDPDTMRVTNVEFDPSRLVPDNKIVLGVDAPHTELSVGMIYDGGTLLPAPPPPLPAITARQFRLGLLDAGITPVAIDNAINNMTDELARARAQIEWEYATSFVRTHPLVATLSAALGLTPEQVDTMWAAAVNL